MKRILAVLGIVLILAIVKVFTGPPPPGKNSWPGVFREYFGNRESKNLPKLIKRYPKETKFLENEIRKSFSSIDENDIELLEKLTQKAVNLLPYNEKQQFIDLQHRFIKNGYAALTENEINTMQQLNQKAFNLLPQKDKLKLSNIIAKSESKAGNNINEQFSDQSKYRLKELVDKLDDSDITVRWKAIVELEKLGPKAKEIVPELIRYLENDDWRVRYYTVEILGMIGPDAKGAVPDLQKMLKDSDWRVRKRASWAISRIAYKQ